MQKNETFSRENVMNYLGKLDLEGLVCVLHEATKQRKRVEACGETPYWAKLDEKQSREQEAVMEMLQLLASMGVFSKENMLTMLHRIDLIGMANVMCLIIEEEGRMKQENGQPLWGETYLSVNPTVSKWLIDAEGAIK